MDCWKFLVPRGDVAAAAAADTVVLAMKRQESNQ